MAGINRGRPAKEYDVKFYVTWNQVRRAFDIKRDGVPTGGFSQDKSTAIGLAIADAQRVVVKGNTTCCLRLQPGRKSDSGVGFWRRPLIIN
jgi:hypothetical protein